MTEQQDRHFDSDRPTNRLVQMLVETHVGVALGWVEVVALTAPVIAVLWAAPPYDGAAGLAILVCMFTGVTIGMHRIGAHRHAVHDVSVWPNYRRGRAFLGGWVESMRADTLPRLVIVYWGMVGLALALSWAVTHVDVSDFVLMSDFLAFLIVVGVPAWSVDRVYRRLAGPRVER